MINGIGLLLPPTTRWVPPRNKKYKYNMPRRIAALNQGPGTSVAGKVVMVGSPLACPRTRLFILKEKLPCETDAPKGGLVEPSHEP